MSKPAGPSFQQTERGYRLIQEQRIPQSRERVWEFFADAVNLERLTPDFLGFQILTPLPIEMHPGTLIEYRIALYGLPMKWQTEISRFDPPSSFVDVQLKGPYALWHHSHEFADCPGGTLMTDVVDYRPPLGPLGSLANVLFVQRTLDRIFRYRREQVVAEFGAL